MSPPEFTVPARYRPAGDREVKSGVYPSAAGLPAPSLASRDGPAAPIGDRARESLRRLAPRTGAELAAGPVCGPWTGISGLRCGAEIVEVDRPASQKTVSDESSFDPVPRRSSPLPRANSRARLILTTAMARAPTSRR